MSASLVRRALEIVDPDCNTNTGQRKKSKRKEVFGLVPDSHKYIAKNPGKNGNKTNLLSTNSKLTVTEARKRHKSKDQILKDNLKKLELIKKASRVNLDKAVVNQIIQRAVTRRPVHKVQNQKKKKKEKQTAFTEEDFKKFEEDYLNE